MKYIFTNFTLMFLLRSLRSKKLMRVLCDDVVAEFEVKYQLEFLSCVALHAKGFLSFMLPLWNLRSNTSLKVSLSRYCC